MTNPGTIGEPGVEERIMTALFTDIADFSQLFRAMDPHQMVRFLNAYLTEMCDIVEAHGGTIDKYEGDAIVAFFGAPTWYQDHAVRASMACIDQQDRLRELRQRWKADRTLPQGLQELGERWEAQGKTFLKVRMGLCAGAMMVGNMGTTRHPNYTVMGDTVNLAARFESGQKMYGTSIMINDQAYDQVKDLVETRRLDLLQVMGKEEPVVTYEVLGRKGALSERRYQVLELYSQGMGAYDAFEFSAAERFFRRALEVDPQDGPSALYADRSAVYARNPPADLIYRGEQVRMVSESDWAQEQQQRLEAQKQLIQELEKELQTAHDLQMRLMPEAQPTVKGLQIVGRCVPANHVGGDLFQYFGLSGGRLAICLADVSGHAMEAAIPVVMFSGILESEMRHGHLLEQLYHDLNRAIFTTLGRHTLGSRTFVCFAMAEFDPVSRTLRLSNAGCPYTYHFRAATREIVELRVDAYPLGVRADTRYNAVDAQLEVGDYVVFCSDGIIEATNVAEEMFGFERTAEVIHRGCVEDLSAEALLQRITAEVKTFSQGVPQGDDQTVVVLKIDNRRSP